MPTRLYREFIKVDPNFIPVFSNSSDQVYPDKWQSFYPHDSFKTILTSVIETLEKGSSKNDWSIWMSGAYGTGKTYASFTVKHILEDPIDNVSGYFEQNTMLPLLARVKGIRAKGDILVVHKSASANINTQNKLFAAIMESVKMALRGKGYAYMGSSSLLEKVLATLKDENSAFNFRGAFQKYRARFTEYTSAESVIKDLEALDTEDQLELLDTIISVAEDENYNWATSPEELIDWLDDVRKGNNIYSIVFIWDEFTEYFRNNQNNITGLQEIAMASARINFYFFLITHSDANQLISDQGARKIIEARFKMGQLRLGESTAFKLMGQALHHEKDLAEDWGKVKQDLWNGVKRGAVSVIRGKDSSMKDEDFQGLLPMQPYAAYLLKFIAQDISSNQRTMFQFLSGDYIEGDKERTNFKWFIEHFGFEYGKWNYLTVDYLWDYFFLADNVDLEGSFTDAISHYNNFAAICDTEDRRRVLKVALLLAALQAKNGSTSRSGATSLFRPTLGNIKACFAGTPLEPSVKTCLDFFKMKGVLGAIEATNDDETVYVMASAQVDKERMDKMTAEARAAYPFEKILSDSTYEPAKQFLPNEFLQYRCSVYYVTATNYRKIADGVNVDSNQIPTFYLFAQNETEQGKTTDIIKYLFGRFSDRCVVVDFTSLPFTDLRYEKFISSKGKEKYWGSIPNQADQLKLAKKASEDIVKEWTRLLQTASLQVYSEEKKITPLSGGANLRKKLKEINASIYGCGLEAISVNDKLFAQSGYKDVVAQIAMGKATIPTNYSYLKFISNALESQGIWSNPDYVKARPDHPVSKMKAKVQEVIDRGFANNSAVRVTDIWNALKQPPFGLLPCTGSVFLVAFLLKEYADSTYYKRDINNNTVGLNYADLSELIYGVIKGLPKANNQFIVKQKPEHTAFCQITGDIFKISKEKRNSIDDVAKNINIYLTNNNYPMWALKYYVEEEYYEHDLRDALVTLVNLFCEFVNPQSYAGRDKTKVAEEINAIYVANPGVETIMGSIVGSDCLRQGMEYYIASYKPEVTTLASKLKIDSNEYLSLLNKKLSADSSYLWQIGDTNRQIDNLYVDLRLIAAINRVLTTKQKDYPATRAALIEKLNIIKMPDSFLQEERPDLIGILQQFYAIRNDRVSDRASTADIIDSLADDFLAFFNGQFDAFSNTIRKHVDAKVTAEELDFLFKNVSSGALFKSTDDFTISMTNALKKYRRDAKNHKLAEEWRKATNTNTPAQWSKEHRIPILCAFSSDLGLAQKVFSALNGSSYLPGQEIDAAIDFVKSPKMNVLKDIKYCEQEFISYFCGEYAYVIEDADSLRETLREIAGSNVYEWYTKRQTCRAAIEMLAHDRYRAKFKAKARDKIHSLSATEAQKYLEELIEKDSLLGIRILKG